MLTGWETKIKNNAKPTVLDINTNIYVREPITTHQKLRAYPVQLL